MPLPNDPIRWNASMDPAEVLDFVMDVSLLLVDGESISTFTVAMSPEGALVGVEIKGGDRAPMVIENGKAVQLWLGVTEAQRSNVSWTGAGTDVGVTINFVTTGTMPRTRERTFALNIRQR